MSTPAKSPAPKTQSKKKKGNVNSLMLPGLDKLPTKKGGKPVVVVVVKGGKNPPQLSNLPFLMKMKKKKGSKKKKSSSVKSGDKKSANKTEEESDLSESDRVSAPELPKAHKKKQTGSTMMSVRSDKSVTGGGATSSTSTTSISMAPSSRTPQLGGLPSRLIPSKTTSDAVLIQGGIIDRPCVPMFMLIDGPVGHPIVVPLDARDENGLVPEGSPPPFRATPKEDIKGFMVVEDGLLHFKPLKEYPQPPPCSTLGTLTKFLSNSNIFIADGGPKLPEEKAINTAPSASIQEKIGVKLAVSGHITILADKGTCKFTRVAAATDQPFYPDNAAMGVLIKDRLNSHLFWIPTENRHVGPLLSQNIKAPSKQAKEMAIVGNVYKDASGIITFSPPSNKLDNLIGFIMTSATGVPMYAAKPEVPPVTSAPSRVKTTPAPSLPPPPAAVAETPPPRAAVVEVQPPSRDEISPPPSASPVPTATSPAVSPPPPTSPPVNASPLPSAPAGPSLGWSLLSTLGSVLTTTASVISTTAGAVTEAAAGAGASLQSPNQPQSPPPPSSSSPSPVVVPVAVPIPAKAAAPPKTAKPPPRETVPPPNEAADEEAAIAAEEAAAAAPPPRVADASSTGAATGVTINITLRDSNSTGGVVADQKSGETFSDALSDGGTGIGDQMASIYRNLLSSQNELPPDQPDQREEESKNEEKVERKATPSVSDESRRKAETTKEYKKYMDDRSVSFSPYGYR